MSVKIVDLLIKYELEMAKLYAVCAKSFPELESFWKELSLEEIKHASNIRELMKEADNKKMSLNESRFNIRPLEISIEHAIDITRRVNEKDLDLLGILSLAYDIESSLIESKYYEIFADKSRNFNNRLKQVRDESRGHARRIREMKQKVYSALGEYS